MNEVQKQYLMRIIRRLGLLALAESLRAEILTVKIHRTNRLLRRT
jgi:hypothetical protein